METDDILTFCQNELPYNSFIAFEEMRKKGQFCDLTINVQNHSFVAHRIILAAAIPYFNSLYANNTVDIPKMGFADADLDPAALESLIHFAYTGKVNISMENLNSLLVASHVLQLKQVTDSCIEFISKRLSVDIVLKVRTLASGLNNLKLIENCDSYIRMNFEKFSRCADFFSLPHSCFKEIIAEEDLNVSSEEVVFDAVMKWTKASPSERHVSLWELLNEVRLIDLPVDYLVDRMYSEELISKPEDCRALVNEVKNYHLLPERSSALLNLKTWPREQLFAFCSNKAYGYSVHHLVNETWRPWSSKKVQGNEKVTHVVGVNDKIYIFLGLFTGTIETFCIKTREWEKLRTAPTDIYGAAVVLYEDKIYCFGSCGDNFMTRLRCFDTKLNQWLEEVEMKTKRWDSAGASLKDSIYVTGGFDEGSINTVERYSPSTGQWSDVASMQTKRYSHGCTALSGKIYVCGGYTTADDNEMNTAEVYDPITNQWNYISPMVQRKCSFTLISHHNRIYALDEDPDVEVYDPKHNEWKCCLNDVPEGFDGAVLIRSSCMYQE